MDCDVGLLSSEIDVPEQQTEVKNCFYSISSPKIDADSDLHTMGQENTWTDDEFLVPPIPDLPIPLPAPSSIVEGAVFEDSTPSSAPEGLLDDFDSLFSPGISTVDPQDDALFDGKALGSGGRCEAGVCGLRNLGNTCFMNSGIQCLVATAPISVEMTQMPFKLRHTLTNTLADLMRKMWSGQCLTVQPTKFKVALANHYPQFNDFRQHDCQEFLALLLDGLHEQLNTAGSKNSACQVDLGDFRSQKNYKSLGLDQGDQSTSSSRRDEEEIQELVNEVSEKQQKCNLDQSSDSTTDAQLLMVEDFADRSPEPCIIPKLDDLDDDDDDEVDGQLNNRNPLLSSSAIKEEIPTMINQVQRMNGFDDFIKKAKTSNLNVLVKKEDANNEIRFDSDKYPRNCNSLCKERFSINALQLDNNTYGKRNSRLSNLSFSLDLHEGLDLKRVKRQSNSDDVEGKNRRMELERRQNSPDFLEKNERMECERKESKDSILCDGLGSSLLSPNFADIRIDKTTEVEADTHWRKHLEENKSIVVNTFQGQFKSTVVCSVCKYISVTYEPFMYLSVPLPNAMQKKLTVTFIGESLKHPTEFLLELNKYDTVSYLRDQILLKVGCEVKGPIMIAEVFNHHLAKFLEEHQLIRHLNDSERSLYAFEVTTLLDKTTVEPIEDIKVEEYLVATSCIICLEDKDANMKHHEECSCILCDTCIADSCNHYRTSTFNCPVCRKKIDPEVHLKPLKVQPSSTSRMMNIPLVFRVDTVGDGNNNQNHVELFGHPMVIRVPSSCSSESLRKELASVLYYKEPFRLLLVDGQGLYCSRCMFHTHCRGCELPAEVDFSSSDSLAVAFEGPVQPSISRPPLALLSTQSSALTLYDCIQAFSQSEVLDGNNPWFCPQCKHNRCATKTLSVWRYPDYLIVYLKRFVFHNHISTKLEEKVLFPLTGLSLASGSDYDLYACVCHIGGVSAGHYTTYAQHPYSAQWHYFNDSSVSKQSPVEEDYSNAYILFYKKQGLQPPPMDNNRVFRQGES